MSVIATLTREHRLFGRLGDRLERSLAYDEKMALGAVREALLVLLPALDRHEEIEGLIFARPAYACGRRAKKLLALVGAQHEELDGLRGDITDILRDSGHVPFERLRSLVVLFVQRLRLHFETEETILWPHYGKTMSRSVEQSLERRTRERVRTLELEIQKNLAMMADYLGGIR